MDGEVLLDKNFALMRDGGSLSGGAVQPTSGETFLISREQGDNDTIKVNGQKFTP